MHAPQVQSYVLAGEEAKALLDILADLPLQAVAPLLQLLDGRVLWELVGGAAHLALRQSAGEQLLQAKDTT